MTATIANTKTMPTPRASLSRFAANSTSMLAGSGQLDDRLFRFAKMVCTPMKTSVSTPMTIFVHHELSEPMNWIRAWVTARTITPNNVPKTYPEPPVNIVPPITTEAMTSSSKPGAYKPCPEKTKSRMQALPMPNKIH